MITPFRIGQHILVRRYFQHGLVVGRITSVRQTKATHVVLGENLLTGKAFRMPVHLVQDFYVVVRKRDAKRVVLEHTSWLKVKGTKREARYAAASVASEIAHEYKKFDLPAGMFDAEEPEEDRPAVIEEELVDTAPPEHRIARQAVDDLNKAIGALAAQVEQLAIQLMGERKGRALMRDARLEADKKAD